MQILDRHTFDVWIPVVEHANLPNQSIILYYKKTLGFVVLFTVIYKALSEAIHRVFIYTRLSKSQEAKYE